MKVKKVYKYGTGQPIPKGAVYLNTIAQKETRDDEGYWSKIWLVWHYFLVEVEDNS